MGDAPETPDPADLTALQSRFRRMVAALALCGAAALAGLVCYFAAHLGWGLWLFVAALVSGFAAQVWFVAAIRR